MSRTGSGISIVALGADLLADQRHREQRRQIVGADRLAGAGMQDGGGRRQIGGDVVPNARNPIFAHLILDAVAHTFPLA